MKGSRTPSACAALSVLPRWRLRSPRAACVLAGSAAAREFRAADTQAADYPTVRALEYMGRLIEQRTDGRHRIRVFHSRQLGEEKETIEQTRAGAIDINRTNVGPLGSLVPVANALALPFLFRSVEHLHAVLDGPLGDEILASFEKYGFVGLTFYDSGARSIYNSKKPVYTLADLKGLRIRIQQSELMAEMIRALGAQPVELPYGQVETGLATGLVDGAENNWPSYVTTGHYKYARNYTLTEHTMSPEVLIMSLRAWQSLSDADKVDLPRGGTRSRTASCASNGRRWKPSRHVSARQAGVTIVSDFDRKPFETAMAKIHAQAAADPVIGPMIDRIRQVK